MLDMLLEFEIHNTKDLADESIFQFKRCSHLF